MTLLKRSLGAVLALGAAALILLWSRPPDLIRVGANYTAKIVCSNVFLAGRDPHDVLASDVQAPGHPLLRLMRVDVDRERGVVRAGLLGFIGGGLAQARPDVGCAVLPDGKLAATSWAAGAAFIATNATSLRPGGAQSDPALERIIGDDALAGRGMRAVVVVHHGHIVAERYAPGFDYRTPQLGWSMTKSVMAGLMGILVEDGSISLDESAGWTTADGRDRIKIADLMAMSSGLRFNEGYGAVSDVTRMLYLEPDMAGFARDQPLQHPAGAVWSYSSGSAVVLSRLFQEAAGSDGVAFAKRRLFGPLGMASATLETDERGTPVGSSYLYATPRDWAKYGQLLVQDGLWNGQEILPRGYVTMMSSPVPASGGEYGRGLVWRWAVHSDKPGENPDAAFGIPPDTFWMSGHDGQYVAVIPSRQLVVVRMGLTPVRENYRPEPLLQALLVAVPPEATTASAGHAGNPQ